MKTHIVLLSLILLFTMVGELLFTIINPVTYFEISADAGPAENPESENEEPVKEREEKTEKEKYDELYHQAIIIADSKLRKSILKWLLSNARLNNLPTKVISPPPEFMFLES